MAHEGSLAVVIPAYNEGRTIRRIASEALDRADRVIVVDDGSQDDTAREIADLPVELLRQPGNTGKAAALRRGLEAALADGAEGIVTLDGDGQHRPKDIDRLAIAGFRAGERIVVGNRLHDRQAFPPARLRANEIANFWISWAAGHPISDSQSGFRFYPASLLREIDWSRLRSDGFVFESQILIEAARIGYRTTAVPIPALYGESSYRPSHFRPVRDIARIVLMVARSLLSRGFYPMGLWRAMRESPEISEPEDANPLACEGQIEHRRRSQ